jgi:hypothetical protein
VGDYNVLQALSQYATANGIDSGMGLQREVLDKRKDIQKSWQTATPTAPLIRSLENGKAGTPQ